MESKPDDDQDQESNHFDHQDVQVEDSPEKSTLSPPNFGDLIAPEVVSH